MNWHQGAPMALLTLALCLFPLRAPLGRDSSEESDLRTRATAFASACKSKKIRKVMGFYDPKVSWFARREESWIIGRWGYEEMNLVETQQTERRGFTRFQCKGAIGCATTFCEHLYYWVLRDGVWYVNLQGPWCAKDSPENRIVQQSFEKMAEMDVCGNEDYLQQARAKSLELVSAALKGEDVRPYLSRSVYLELNENSWDPEGYYKKKADYIKKIIQQYGGTSKIVNAGCLEDGVCLANIFDDADKMREGEQRLICADMIRVWIVAERGDPQHTIIGLEWVLDEEGLKLWNAS